MNEVKPKPYKPRVRRDFWLRKGWLCHGLGALGTGDTVEAAYLDWKARARRAERDRVVRATQAWFEESPS